MNFIGYRTVKTSIGVIIAMYIASFLNLKFYSAAGIIVILSLQNTRKLSYNLAYQRIAAFILSISIAVIIFFFLGYSSITFGLIILLFIPIAVKLKVSEGIIVNSVLVSHLLIEQSISFSLLLNEMGLMLIGVLVALFLNLYMPSNEHIIIDCIKSIDSKIKEILNDMSNALKDQTVPIREEENFRDLENQLKFAEKQALTHMNNNFVNTKKNYYVAYIEMRYQQFLTLKRMRDHFQRFFMTYNVTITIAEYTKKVSDSITEDNNASWLLSELDQLRISFKSMSLPSTREEFENRAMLFQYLNDIEVFLDTKMRFHLKYKK